MALLSLLQILHWAWVDQARNLIFDRHPDDFNTLKNVEAEAHGCPFAKHSAWYSRNKSE